MERAELANGSIEVRGSGAVHRVLNFLGAFFLGIGTEARRESENWWDRDEPMPRESADPMVLGQQAEMFDEFGQATVAPAERVAPAAVEPGPAAARSPVRAVPQTIVSVQARSPARARAVVTTRAAAVPRVAAMPRSATVARGAVARQLVMSQSISSGKEESRWFSVPQRVLLPRYQLFEGAEGVQEDAGGLRIASPSLRTQNGRVWFV